jgi:hypothetical protein
MKMRIAGLLVVVLAVMLVPAALPQMEPTPVVYTYVSQFQIPRANWVQYSEDTEKTFVPVVEKSLATGASLAGLPLRRWCIRPTDIRTERRGRRPRSQG